MKTRFLFVFVAILFPLMVSATEIEAGGVYNVSVNATKDGNIDSDKATTQIKPSTVKGDLNGDGKVDAADHVELSNIIMWGNKEESGIEQEIGDYEQYYPYGLSGNLWDEKIVSNMYLNDNGIPAQASTPAFISDSFIPVAALTDYYLVSPNTYCRVAQYNSNKEFISFLGYLQTGEFTTSENCAYLRFWYPSDTYSGGISIKPISDDLYNKYTPYETAIDYVARAQKEEKEYIIIGSGYQYETIIAGFSAAISNDVGCIIMPGVYDIVAEGSSSGTGLFAPKHIIGYGAKIVANLPSENWDYSPINIVKTMREVIIEGLEIEVTNCRYCVHDEMYNVPNYYHHVFKNCKMKHNSPNSSVLIGPKCIGGGFGNSCLVEIEKCEFSSKEINGKDCDYHANSTGQTGNCIVKCNDCVFEHTISLTPNSLTGFKNLMYVSGCLVGSQPVDPDTANSKLIGWNNVLNQ